MRFQRPDNKSPWMNQKEQLRLVMLCVALVFVIVAMQKVAQPEFWSWLIPPEQVTQETNAETDQVVITLSGERVPTDEEAGSEKQALITELPPLLSEAEKQNIEDDYLGLKKTEVPVFQRIVTELTQTDRGLLQLNTDRSGTYQVWMAETDAWRGRLIEFDGHARRILKRENSTENQNGNLYDLWVTTEGSGSMPLHVVTAGLPAEMEIGEQLNIPIHLSGTLFKREGYAAEGGLRTTLLIAAAPPVLQVINSTPSAPNKLVPMMMLMAVVLCLFIIFSLWKTFRSIFTPPVSKPLRLAEEPEPDLSELEADELSEQFTSPDDISNEDNQSL